MYRGIWELGGGFDDDELARLGESDLDTVGGVNVLRKSRPIAPPTVSRFKPDVIGISLCADPDLLSIFISG